MAPAAYLHFPNCFYALGCLHFFGARLTVALARAGLVIFGLGAVVLGGAALGDIVMHGTLTIFSPLILVALALLGVGLLLSGLVDARFRAHTLQTQASELHTLTAELERSLSTVSAINARLHESEVRYKGLVNAQGDAIFRRAPDSRLTYGNEAFFRLFGLVPQAALGKPFAPELHPDSRAPFFGSFGGGLETGRARVAWRDTQEAMRFGPDFREDHTLRDGTHVALRMIRPSDKELLRDAITRLSPESRYRRFLAPIGDPTDEMLRYLTEIDGVDHVAIVAETDSLDLKTERPLGVARFVRLPESPEVAEAAVTVADSCQARGLGKLLLATLAEAALERGITKFRGEVLASNAQMRHLLEVVGAQQVSTGDGALAFDVSLTEGEKTGAMFQRLLRAAGQQMFEVLRRFT